MRGVLFTAIVLAFTSAAHAQLSLEEAQERLRAREAMHAAAIAGAASTQPSATPATMPATVKLTEMSEAQTLTQLQAIAELRFRAAYAPPPPPVRNATAVQQQSFFDAIQKGKDELDYQYRAMEERQTIAVILVNNVFRKGTSPERFVVQGNFPANCSSYAGNTNLGPLGTFAQPVFSDPQYAKLHGTAAQSKFSKDLKKWQLKHDTEWCYDIEIQTTDTSVANWSVGDIYAVRVTVDHVVAQLQPDNHVKLSVSCTEIIPEVAGTAGGESAR